MARTSLHRRSAPPVRKADRLPVPAGWYHVLVMNAQLRVTRSGTYVIVMDLQVVTPREYFGRRLTDVLVPLVGEHGEEVRRRTAGYGIPQFINDDYLGGGRLPVGNEADLALVAAELTGRTAHVHVKRWTDHARGTERNTVIIVTQQEPERVVA